MPRHEGMLCVHTALSFRYRTPVGSRKAGADRKEHSVSLVAPLDEASSELGCIDLEEHDGAVVLKLVGDHDLAASELLHAALAHRVLDGQPTVVSLAETSFIDSSVIRALVVADRGLSERGRRLVLYSEPGSPPDRVLQLCRLNETLLFGDTLDEAVMFARQGGAHAPAA